MSTPTKPGIVFAHGLWAVPYGQSSSLLHVVGGTASGGFEWAAGFDHAGLAGRDGLDTGMVYISVACVACT